MLRKMARKPHDLRRERQETLRTWVGGIETGRAQTLRIDTLTIPPLHGARQLIHFRETQAQSLSDVAQGASRPVRNDGGREGRPFTAVFSVDVLNDFFAPLMFEIHVDIRRLVAFLGNESLEQHRHAGRIHLGDFQAVADDGIGRRSAPLAEYFLRPGVLHDIVHREEKRLEFEFRDQMQFMFDALPHGLGRSRRPALEATGLGQSAQMTGRRLAGGHDFLGILITQFIELEPAAFGDRERFRQQP